MLLFSILFVCAQKCLAFYALTCVFPGWAMYLLYFTGCKFAVYLHGLADTGKLRTWFVHSKFFDIRLYLKIWVYPLL